MAARAAGARGAGALAEALPPLSIDTTKAEVARRALAAGAAIVNDIWGFQRDPELAGAVAETGVAAVVMHNRERRDGAIDIVDDMLRFFERSLGVARGAGVPDDRIVLDPGIGFGKTHRQEFEAIAALPRLKALGFPVLLGVSRKSFIGRLFDPAPAWPNGFPARSPRTPSASFTAPTSSACTTSRRTCRRSRCSAR